MRKRVKFFFFFFSLFLFSTSIIKSQGILLNDSQKQIYDDTCYCKSKTNDNFFVRDYSDLHFNRNFKIYTSDQVIIDGITVIINGKFSIVSCQNKKVVYETSTPNSFHITSSNDNLIISIVRHLPSLDNEKTFVSMSTPVVNITLKKEADSVIISKEIVYKYPVLNEEEISNRISSYKNAIREYNAKPSAVETLKVYVSMYYVFFCALNGNSEAKHLLYSFNEEEILTKAFGRKPESSYNKNTISSMENMKEALEMIQSFQSGY